MKFVHCGGANEYGAIRKAWDDMIQKFYTTPTYKTQERDDYNKAMNENSRSNIEFMNTPTYKKWTAGKTNN